MVRYHPLWQLSSKRKERQGLMSTGQDAEKPHTCWWKPSSRTAQHVHTGTACTQVHAQRERQSPRVSPQSHQQKYPREVNTDVHTDTCKQRSTGAREQRNPIGHQLSRNKLKWVAYLNGLLVCCTKGCRTDSRYKTDGPKNTTVEEAKHKNHVRDESVQSTETKQTGARLGVGSSDGRTGK